MTEKQIQAIRNGERYRPWRDEPLRTPARFSLLDFGVLAILVSWLLMWVPR